MNTIIKSAADVSFTQSDAFKKAMDYMDSFVADDFTTPVPVNEDTKVVIAHNNMDMDKNLKTTLLYSLQDYIGAFSLLDALPYSFIRPEHVKPFVKAENDLQSTIDLAKHEYQSSQDNNLYGLIVGAESAIKSAKEVLEADAKDRKVEIFG